MTTKITVEPAGHHVLVLVTDSYQGDVKRQQTLLQPRFHYVDNAQVDTGQGPWVGHATTTRTISVVDLDPLDPRVVAANGRHNAPVA